MISFFLSGFNIHLFLDKYFYFIWFFYIIILIICWVLVQWSCMDFKESFEKKQQDPLLVWILFFFLMFSIVTGAILFIKVLAASYVSVDYVFFYSPELGLLIRIAKSTWSNRHYLLTMSLLSPGVYMVTVSLWFLGLVLLALLFCGVLGFYYFFYYVKVDGSCNKFFFIFFIFFLLLFLCLMSMVFYFFIFQFSLKWMMPASAIIGF